jgi:hypothetical protein
VTSFMDDPLPECGSLFGSGGYMIVKDLKWKKKPFF